MTDLYIPPLYPLMQEDLVPLLTQQPPDKSLVRYRQGLVVSWNTSTGENVVNVGGALLENLPMLNSNDSVRLQAGHVVALLAAGSSMLIIGRVVKPGSADYGSAAIDYGQTGFTVSNFAVAGSGVMTVVGSATLTVPDWADQALVMVTASGQITNPSVSNDFAFLSVGVNGGSGGAPGQPLAPTGNTLWQDRHPIYASTRNLLSGLTAGSKTLTIEARCAHSNAGAWAANANNTVFAHAMAFYRSTV